MHPAIAALNDLLNSTPVLRPVKWKASDLVHRMLFHRLRLNPGKIRVQVHGMRRTGNHAVINWIIKGRPGNSSFCNDLNIGQHPATAPMKRSRVASGEGTMITSYEEIRSDQFDLNEHTEWYGTVRRTHHVLILRDPYNLFASRYVWNDPQGIRFREDRAYRNSVVELWKDHARTFLKWAASKPSSSDHEFHPINYNDWLLNARYREIIGKKIELLQRHEGLQDVTNYGGGSSFEGLHTPNKDEIRYIQRFTGLLNDTTFISIFEDAEMIDLATTIFGDLPRLNELLEKVQRHSAQ